MGRRPTVGVDDDALALDKGPEQLKSEYATMSLAELDNRQPEIMANMQEAQEALGTIGSQITNLQTLPERAQASVLVPVPQAGQGGDGRAGHHQGRALDADQRQGKTHPAL